MSQMPSSSPWVLISCPLARNHCHHPFCLLLELTCTRRPPCAQPGDPASAFSLIGAPLGLPGVRVPAQLWPFLVALRCLPAQMRHRSPTVSPRMMFSRVGPAVPFSPRGCAHLSELDMMERPALCFPFSICGRATEGSQPAASLDREQGSPAAIPGRGEAAGLGRGEG